MTLLRVVTVVGLLLYAARIVEAYFLGVGLLALTPYAGAVVSWCCLASWQRKGVPWLE